MTSVATLPGHPPADASRHGVGWIAAWKAISREQCVGAAILGVAVALPVLFQFSIARIVVGWRVPVEVFLNAEISAFTLLLALAVADQAVDRGARRLTSYSAAVVIAAIGGVLVATAHSHLLWDAILQPNAIFRKKMSINPWVVYTRHVYQVIEWMLVGGLATYVYVDRRDARRMVARLHEAGLRHSAQAKSMFESELQTLQARVEPGFLFQTLSQVRDLYEIDARAADSVLDELIIYLRAAMPRMRDTAAVLAQELELARSWLAIVDSRRVLAVTVECDTAAASARIPSMLLLPLTSAMLAQRRRPDMSSTLRVRATIVQSRVRIVLTLEPGDEAEVPRGTVVNTLRDRLTALFGTQAVLVVSATDGRIEAALEIPMKSPTALIAEDEPILRAELKEMLARLWPELVIVAEAQDGIDALRLLGSTHPDVLVLDIQMPGVSGLDVARHASGRCHVVFITAYDQYAVAAFEHGAVDYVMKPLSPARLAATVARLKDKVESKPANLESLLSALSQTHVRKEYIRWVKASQGQELRLITIDEVCYFQSDNKYTLVVTPSQESLIRRPIRELIDDLDPAMFWQIHRGTVINVNAIAGVVRDIGGRLRVKFKDRKETLQVSEAHAHLFRSM